MQPNVKFLNSRLHLPLHRHRSTPQTATKTVPLTNAQYRKLAFSKTFVAAKSIQRRA